MIIDICFAAGPFRAKHFPLPSEMLIQAPHGQGDVGQQRSRSALGRASDRLTADALLESAPALTSIPRLAGELVGSGLFGLKRGRWAAGLMAGRRCVRSGLSALAVWVRRA